MPYQVRIYTINRGKLEDFASLWKSAVYPLRLELGFRIPFAQIVPETNQFIWCVGYDTAEPWERKEQAYYRSPEREAMDPDPAQWIARAEEYFSWDVPEQTDPD